MSSECCLPLPPTQCHEFCGLEEPAEREGDPRAPPGAARPLKNYEKRSYLSLSCQSLQSFAMAAPLLRMKNKQDINII